MRRLRLLGLGLAAARPRREDHGQQLRGAAAKRLRGLVHHERILAQDPLGQPLGLAAARFDLAPPLVDGVFGFEVLPGLPGDVVWVAAQLPVREREGGLAVGRLRSVERGVLAQPEDYSIALLLRLRLLIFAFPFAGEGERRLG